MSKIKINEILQKKMIASTGDDAPAFKFETVGDQIIAKFIDRRTVPTKRGEPADLIEMEILAGEKINGDNKPTPVQPGAYIAFLGTHQRQIFDREKLAPGRVFRMMLCGISGRGFKKFAYETVDPQDINF